VRWVFFIFSAAWLSALIRLAVADNVLQISEGTNSVGFCVGIWAFAYVLLPPVLLTNLI
jgi:hypothetical protein